MSQNTASIVGSKVDESAALAEAYLLSRQSTNGGFCFYRSEFSDEPNLSDTYHAVAALMLLHGNVPRAHRVVDFVRSFESLEFNAFYFQERTLDLLGLSPRLSQRRLGNIRRQRCALPVRRIGPLTGWLARADRMIRLQHCFGVLQEHADLKRFVRSLRCQGGYGQKPNLQDTLFCLRMLRHLGDKVAADDTRQFVDRLQRPSFGFSLTLDSLFGNLEIVHAGVQCCEILELPVRYSADAIGYVQACQTSSGGFARAPNALPNIELTRRALEIFDAIRP
jgi:hypothetical protein